MQRCFYQLNRGWLHDLTGSIEYGQSSTLQFWAQALESLTLSLFILLRVCLPWRMSELTCWGEHREESLSSLHKRSSQWPDTSVWPSGTKWSLLPKAQTCARSPHSFGKEKWLKTGPYEACDLNAVLCSSVALDKSCMDQDSSRRSATVRNVHSKGLTPSTHQNVWTQFIIAYSLLINASRIPWTMDPRWRKWSTKLISLELWALWAVENIIEHHSWRCHWCLCFTLLCVLSSESLDQSQLITSYSL